MIILNQNVQPPEYLPLSSYLRSDELPMTISSVIRSNPDIGGGGWSDSKKDRPTSDLSKNYQTSFHLEVSHLISDKLPIYSYFLYPFKPELLVKVSGHNEQVYGFKFV